MYSRIMAWFGYPPSPSTVTPPSEVDTLPAPPSRAAVPEPRPITSILETPPGPDDADAIYDG